MGAAFTRKRGPHIKIKALIPKSEKKIIIVPDSGSSVNLVSGTNCRDWGISVESLEPGEGHLFDIQGCLIPVLGRANIDIFLPSRGISASVSVRVVDVPSLEGLVVGWEALQSSYIFAFNLKSVISF